MKRTVFAATALALTITVGVTPALAKSRIQNKNSNQGIVSDKDEKTEKGNKKAEKEAEKLVKEAEKEAKKADKEAEKEAKKAEKESEKAAKKAEKEAEKEAKKQNSEQEQDVKDELEWYENIKDICAERANPELLSAVQTCDAWSDQFIYFAGYDAMFDTENFGVTIGDYAEKRISIGIDPYTGEGSLIIDFSYPDRTRFAVDMNGIPAGEMEDYILNMENITWPGVLDLSALGVHDITGDARLLIARLLYMSDMEFDGTNFKLTDSGLVFDEDYSDVDLYGNYSGELAKSENPWILELPNTIASLDCSWEQDGEYCYGFFEGSMMGSCDAVYYSASDNHVGIGYDQSIGNEDRYFFLDYYGDFCVIMYSIYRDYVNEEGEIETHYYGLDITLNSPAQYAEVFSSLENLMDASSFLFCEGGEYYYEWEGVESNRTKADVCENFLSDINLYMNSINEGLAYCNTNLSESGLTY